MTTATTRNCPCDSPAVHKRVWIALCATALVVVVFIGLRQADQQGGSDGTTQPLRLTAGELTRALAGSPTVLARLHADANDILPGGGTALKTRLAELRGHPVVVNFWASWCGPCNLEAPVVQRVSLSQGRTVAFIGMDFNDERSAAKDFARRYPVTYPSYEDTTGSVLRSYGLSGYVPATVFVDANGVVQYAHQGPYLSQARLQRDITRYASG